MAFILTLVASSAPLTETHARDAARLLSAAPDIVWTSPAKAADMALPAPPSRAQTEALWALLAPDRIDVFVTEAATRRARLLIADMDATIVAGETLDELAGHAGLHDKVSAITARAMRGELDFASALKERVALLAGLPVAALAETLDRTALNPGASVLVRTMAAHGATCVLVSGGFTFFTSAVARKAGFAHDHGNALEIEGGALTGRVRGDILDKEAKLRFLNAYAAQAGLPMALAMAIGDGANDLPMLRAAGFGVGFRPKPLVRAGLSNCILHGDLTAALYAQGYRDEDFTREEA